VIHLVAALFFTGALLVAAVSIHLTVKLYWSDILLALRGELGVRQSAPRATVRPSPVYATPQRRAAA
jgi:hypothetical protein